MRGTRLARILAIPRTWTCCLAFAALAAGCAKPSSHTGSDAGRDAGGDAGPPGLTCGELLRCDQPCNSNDCTNNCYAESTAVAQGIFNSFDDCLNAACASTDGGPCADSSSTACANCNQSSATGVCVSHLEGCEQDMTVGPPNPSGAAVTPDAGVIFNCGELLACVSACATATGACATSCTAEATPTAVALEGALNGCLAVACPSTDGGPCATPGLACNGCIEQVTLADPDTCATPYIACNSDTSNAPDGGVVPTALVDGGVIVTVLGGLDQCASTMVAGNGYLYFTQVTSDTPVSQITLADGGVTTLGPPQPTPVSLALDSDNVYVWSVGTFGLASSINNHDGTVVQVPLNGGPAITLEENMEVLYDAAYLNAVAIDSSNVYWVSGASGGDGAIMKTSIGGGTTPVAIFPGQYIPQAVVTDGTNVYWADWGTFDAQGRANNDGTLWQGSVNGGTPIQLASNQPAPSAIALAAGSVFWCDLGPLGGDNLPALNSGSVLKVPIGGGTVTTIASSQAVPVAIIASGPTIYWTEYGLNSPGLIMSVPAAGGPVAPVAVGLSDPAELVVSGDTLYWTNDNSSPTAGFISSLTPF